MIQSVALRQYFVLGFRLLPVSCEARERLTRQLRAQASPIHFIFTPCGVRAANLC